jgi:hypothetical protein
MNVVSGPVSSERKEVGLSWSIAEMKVRLDMVGPLLDTTIALTMNQKNKPEVKSQNFIAPTKFQKAPLPSIHLYM